MSKVRFHSAPLGLADFLTKNFPHGVANKVLAEYHVRGVLPETIFHCGKMYMVRRAYREHMFSVAVAAVEKTPVHGAQGQKST
jgi:hypothetical protein